MATIFIKYSKVNQVRQAFDIATIRNYSMKTCYALSILYYGLIVLCPHMLSVPPPPKYCLFSIYPVRPPLHTIRPPSYRLSVPLLHTVRPLLLHTVRPPLLHTVRPPSYILSVPPSYILSVPPLTYCSSLLFHTVRFPSFILYVLSLK